MDFGSLLHVAKQKAETSKSDVRYYSTKFEPPKKEERSKSLSVNIKKFLARKDAEEKQKAEEAKIKKMELLALRSQDSKAKRRVQVMLKRTKSANKSVIDDAIDNKNTAVTLAGPSQPDEDDYGYESQEAAAYYAKMMERYSSMPEEEKFPGAKKRSVSTNLVGTKDRVKAALLREEEEAALPHKRKRKSKTSDEPAERSQPMTYSSKAPEPEKEVPKPKPKRPAPPPIDFNQLLKIAEKKQFEPIKIEPKKVESEEPLLTKKQRREWEKEKAWRESREVRLRAALTAPSRPQTKPEPPNKIPKTSADVKIPRLNGNQDVRSSKPVTPAKTNTQAVPNGRIPKNNTTGEPKPRPDLKSTDRKPDLNRRPDVPSVGRKLDGAGSFKKPDARPGPNQPNKKPSQSGNSDTSSWNTSRDVRKSVPPSVKIEKSRPLTPSDGKPKQYLPGDLRAKQLPPANGRQRQLPPADGRPRQFPPSDVRPKQFPPADVRPKQFPPPDVRGRAFPPKDVKRKLQLKNNRRIIDDDDSEYDSELDDFIDDGPQGDGEDYSKYISEIFGYDKSRYRDIDEDDSAMESNYSNILKEEYISTKLGIMEDLEDIKKEAEEKKRKAMMKKRK